jgi:UDP-N-acetylglucosamine--N-acetylmuramyl-(pentapeptide) pyrophosphoryl-undecaprenol N-acetylglucosamine transferase
MSASGGVLIMAGGTGGHVFPALAVARRLAERRVPIIWLGTREGIEARAVPAAGLPVTMEWIEMKGVRRTGLGGWLRLPWRLARAAYQAAGVLGRHRPGVVLSFGGYVAAPGGLAALLRGIPLLIHEQNAVAGLTNRWLALAAARVLAGFPGAFATSQARVVGNPVRREIAALPPPPARLAGRAPARLRLLVIGGSLGAAVFNEIVPEALARLPAARRPAVWHQCGRGRLPAVERAYRAAGIEEEKGVVGAVRVEEFVEDMAAAYEWADLVLCRAGAMTVAELAASGSAAILVPYPYAVDDHQTANARFLAERGAALLLPQPEFTAARLAELLAELSASREVLVRMATAARALAVTDADEAVAAQCLEVLHA